MMVMKIFILLKIYYSYKINLYLVKMLKENTLIKVENDNIINFCVNNSEA